MAVEAERGCGFRKVGGIYLVAGSPGEPCHNLPVETPVCPVCGSGIKQSRAWTWIDGEALLSPSCKEKWENPEHVRDPDENEKHCLRCPICSPKKLGKQAGLLWVGELFYKSPGHFMREAGEMGVSKRIKAVPHGFEVGKHWILLAHPKAVFKGQQPDPKNRKKMIDVYAPGIFTCFKPERIEIIITESQSKDEEFMAGVEKRKLTPVIVPDKDPDHNPKGCGIENGNGDDE